MIIPAEPVGMGVKEAAQIMGKCQMFVRIGLRKGIFPWGYATQSRKGGSWNYFINRRAFLEDMRLLEDDGKEAPTNV